MLYLGVTRQQSGDWQRFANVPEAEFEATRADQIEGPTMPLLFVLAASALVRSRLGVLERPKLSAHYRQLIGLTGKAGGAIFVVTPAG